MKVQEYDAPILSDSETMVLQAVCRYYMMGKPFNTTRAARYCGVPVWTVNYHLETLVRRKLANRKGSDYIPAMQINGAPVPMPEIIFENGIKIIKCPKMYAQGYARCRYL